MNPTVATIALLTALAGVALSVPTEKSFRTGDELCRELEYELTLSVSRDMLTSQEAEQIINRCYRMYGGLK